MTQPKRIAAAGYKVSGLVMANQAARAMLRGEAQPSRVVVAEGEPDHLTAAIRWPTCAVIGIVSGAWNDELAARIPDGCEVVLRMDSDEAGERYAAEVAESLAGRCKVWRVE